MKVYELAEKLNISSEEILKKLKSLRLKAVDKDQELNKIVISVLKTEFAPKKKTVKKTVKKKTSEEKTITKKKVKVVDAPVDKKKKTEKEKTTVKKKATVKSKETQKETVKKKTVIIRKAAPKSKAAEEKKEAIKKEEIKKETGLKKNIVKKDVAKTRSRMSKEPVITLKPLARKKRKITDDKSKGFVGHQDNKGGSSQREDAPQISQIFPKVEGPLTDLEIKVPITVKDLSVKVQQKPSVILSQLMKMGVLCHINQSLDKDIVELIAKNFGFNLLKIKTQEEQLVEWHKTEEEDPKLLKPRAPVVTFMGHVDHGKTSLLDRIRKSKITDEEHGGITQHMGAYSVKTGKGLITFLDTPGHEAFTAMRSRGAHITDLIVLVVAADEGIMPQTEEAIDHARAANVPIVVALNKIDKKNADPDRVKKQLTEKDLSPEDWGGNTIVINVSATTGEGIDNLLESMLLESELLELKANPDKKASGIVVEANLSHGKGAVTSLIVQSGTLKEGDFIVVGSHYGKVRAMFDDFQTNVKAAGPSVPVEVLGLSDVPEAGDLFYVVDDEKQAREISLRRKEQIKHKRLGMTTKITLEDLYSQMQQGNIKELNVIMKADVQGSLEALKDSLEKIPSDKVKIKFIHTGIGDVNASDVILAVASQAIIIAFHVGIGPRAKQELEKDPVDIRQYRIIYDAVNDVRNALEGLLEAKKRKDFRGRIEVRQVFKLSKQGIVSGCYVLKGKAERKAHVDVIRGEETIFSGKISSLKRFKDDVKEVREGTECGITIDGFDKVEPGDILETYEVISIAQKL